MTKCDNSSYGRTYLYKSYGWIHSGENAQTRFTILYNLNVYKKNRHFHNTTWKPLKGNGQFKPTNFRFTLIFPMCYYVLFSI